MNADFVGGRRGALRMGREAALRWKGVVKRVPHFAKTIGMATLSWKIEGEGPHFIGKLGGLRGRRDGEVHMNRERAEVTLSWK